MSKWMVLAWLLLPLAASAEPRPTMGPVESTPHAPPVDGTVPAPYEQYQAPTSAAPTSAPATPTCNDLVPPEIESSSDEFETLLSVRITPDGDMRDASVFHSSGNKDFDRAAISCSMKRRLGSITRNGKPVEINWVMRVYWRRRWPFLFLAASPNSKPHECGKEWYPRAAYGAFIQGDTRLAYMVAEDGSVKDAKVAESSGDPDLDSAAVNCVSGWRYYPAEEHGKPIEFDLTTVIRWRRHF
jgi:TonB family protein